MEKNHLLAGNTTVANRIICHVWNKVYANDFMPGGTHLTACGKGGFKDTKPVYRRLLQYVEEQRPTISGDAYEERLIDEIGALDKERQIIQVSIAIAVSP